MQLCIAFMDSFVYTFQMLSTCLWLFFCNYKKYLLIFFVFYYTFVNTFKTLSTSSSRFGLKYYIGSITISGESCGLNFWIRVTKASIIDTCSHKIMIRKPRLQPWLHGNMYLFGVCQTTDWKSFFGWVIYFRCLFF